MFRRSEYALKRCSIDQFQTGSRQIRAQYKCWKQNTDDDTQIAFTSFNCTISERCVLKTSPGNFDNFSLKREVKTVVPSYFVCEEEEMGVGGYCGYVQTIRKRKQCIFVV
jgi:hypothetical protein